MTWPEVEWTSGSDKRFIVVMQTLHRAADQQTIFMGAVARTFDYQDRARMTSIHADDLANGSALAVSRDGEARECGTLAVARRPAADFIWVVDESGSMQGERTLIAGHAATFFQRALDYGMDFRLGVTDMNDASEGAFATRAADGTGERWILPDEPGVFSDAVADPSGPAAGDGASEHGLTQALAAMNRHLPRDLSDPFKIRPDAELALILVTDERADEIEDAGVLNEGNGSEPPNASHAASIQGVVTPFAEAFAAEEAVVHVIAEPPPWKQSPCAAEHADGYYELAQALAGQTGSICEMDLTVVIDAMLDSVAGDASPVRLDYVPISSSISITREGEYVPRSRVAGWDYRASSNAIVFHGMPFDLDTPAEIKISYRRWQDQ